MVAHGVYMKKWQSGDLVALLRERFGIDEAKLELYNVRDK